MTVIHFKIFVENNEIWDNLFLYSLEDFHTGAERNERRPVSDRLDSQKFSSTSVAIYKVGHDKLGSIMNLSIIEKLEESKFCSVMLNRESGDTSDTDQTFITVIYQFEKLLNVSRKSKTIPTFTMSGYFMNQFFRTLIYSLEYRKLVIRNFVLNQKHHCEDCVSVNIKLNNVGSFIDHRWFERIERLYIERRELDNIMSWLSTLGGGFSALGEYQPAFAFKAGQISRDQMKLALRLGDDLVVSRCKLYFSLSLIQRGYLKLARKIIEEQFTFAKSYIVCDRRLLNMCKGIWVKLKYEHRLRRYRKHGDISNRHIS